MIILATLFALGALRVSAEDWFRWRGPHLNGISTETGWTTEWPQAGPRRLWKAAVGIGFSSITVANGRAYTTGNEGDVATIFCFEAETGQVLWRHAYPSPLAPKWYEGGTSSTPTVDGKVVYHLSREGALLCLDAASGAVVWQNHLVKELDVAVPEWGFASSPLVEGDLLLLNVGSAGTAVEKNSGKVVWTSAKGSAGYATPVPYNVGKERCAAIFSFRDLIGVEVRTGRELWRYEVKTAYDTNAGDPIVYHGRFFVASHSVEGALIEIANDQPAVVWRNQMRVHLNAGVRFGYYLYGFHGSAGKPGDLRCVDLRTGQTVWSQEGFGVGSLMAAEGKLIVLSERGELVIAEASPAGFKSLARAQVLGGKCWTVPVLSNGRIYCRNARGDLVCLAVR